VRGNPAPALLVPAAQLGDPRPLGEGRHLACTLAAGGARSRAVAFGRGDRLPVEAGAPVDAAVRLEPHEWNGALEPRLVLRHVRPAQPGPVEVLGEPESFAAGVRAELARPLEPWPPAAGGAAWPGVARPAASPPAAAPGATPGASDAKPGGPGISPPGGATRTLRDCRGGGLAGLLGDLVAAGAPVLAVAAHAPRRAAALAERVGGFAVCSWAALEDRPGLAEPFAHVVALDPPAHRHLHEGLAALPGRGWVHLAWGAPEIAFAQRVHAWDFALRPALAALYRALRAAGEARGPLCEALLRGDGTPPRSPALAGRLVRVLAELGLVSLEPAGAAELALVTPAAPAHSPLERSAAWRAYERRRADGEAHLAALLDADAAAQSAA